MNAAELFTAFAALPGSQEAGTSGNGIAAARLVNGVEYARASVVDEAKLRSAYRKRQGGGATPLVLVTDDPDADGMVRVLGPQRDGPVRRVRAESLFGLVEKTLSLKRLLAVRLVAEEVERLDTERIAGLKVRGLGTEHLYGMRLPDSGARWAELAALAEGVSRAGWRELLNDLGYAIEQLPGQGYLAKHEGRPVLVVHPRASAAQFAKLDDEGRLPEGALVADCQAHGAAYGLLAAGSRVRLLRADAHAVGATTRYLELDAASLEPDHLPLLGLLAPPFLAEEGLSRLLDEARDYGQQLRLRLDRVLRQHVLPVLGRELGRWAQEDGRDVGNDAVRAEVEAAALTFVFRVLFLLYAESAGHLPMTNPTYESKSLTRVARRAVDELEQPDERATALWDDVALLVKRMRTGQRAWDLPAYNGDLFAPDAIAGALLLEDATVPDAALAPPLVALARDPDDVEVGVDFSGLEVGHLGYIYEGLLSLRLSVADRDLRYDERRDRYVAPGDGDGPDVRAGELLWLTDEGGRKGGGVYYTRTELVRHLVRGAVGPAFDAHLQEVEALAPNDPAAAARKLFEFYVLDPACGSAHFLVEVVDELADKIGALLGRVALPAVTEELERLRAGAGATFGAGIEDTALLKRLVLKRCVFGVDLSPMGAEIAKVSLWLGTFVPGLSLAYLDHNVQCGNSLIGVARPEAIAPPGDGGQVVMFGDEIAEVMAEASRAAARLRAIDDRTPDEVAASHRAHDELHAAVAGAERVFDLWTAEPLELLGARDEVWRRGEELLAGQKSLLADKAGALARRERFLHWPLAFAEVFDRERPGFDAVVGNPPWDEVTLEQPSFFARYQPGIRRGIPEEERQQAITDLIHARPNLVELFEQEKARLLRYRQYFQREYESGGGDPDLYRFFTQRYQQLLRPHGRLAVVLPRTAFVNKGSRAFREWLFTCVSTSRVDFLINRARWAFDSEPRYTVALVSAVGTEPSPDHAVEIAGPATSVRQWNEQAACSGVTLARNGFGAGWAPPLLGRQEQADVLMKLRAGQALPTGAGRWEAFPSADFHETKHRRLWSGATDGWPLWKGESFGQYEPHGAHARTCPATDEALRIAVGKNPGAKSATATRHSTSERLLAVRSELGDARVAFSDVTQKDNSRTVVACLVPPKTFVGNTAPYLAFLAGRAEEKALCLSLLNSLTLDWQARRFAEVHMNFFILESLRVPVLDDATSQELARAAARLSCPDERFRDFAVATGVDIGPLPEEKRIELRADIDARVARAYGLTSAELEVVFDDFTTAAVPLSYRDQVRARFAELGG